jgi:hypothetical protein
MEEKHEIVAIVAEVTTALSELRPYELRRISAFQITEHTVNITERERTVISDVQSEAYLYI